jgi:hypothetical protein
MVATLAMRKLADLQEQGTLSRRNADNSTLVAPPIQERSMPFALAPATDI